MARQTARKQPREQRPQTLQSSYQTSEAAEKCLNEKRKTINGEDILTSMRALGFDNYEGVLKVYLTKFREVSCCSDFAWSLSCLCLPWVHLDSSTSFFPRPLLQDGSKGTHTVSSPSFDPLRRQSIP